MQISIVFKGDQIELPIATGETVQGLIYRAVSGDKQYAYTVHEAGKAYDGRKYKLFTFGELKGRYRTDGKFITYFSQVALEIRSVDSYFVQLLFLYFANHRFVRLGDNDVEVQDVRIDNRTVFENEVVVRTLSPITAYVTEADKHTTYFSPDDMRFYSAIVANARRKWLSFGGDESDFCFEIYPCEDTGFVKRATRFKDTFITAWHGCFLLKGSPKVIDFLYNTGVGSKNSQGFGMFELYNGAE